MITESRRKTARGIEIVVSGEGVQPTDAVVAEVIMEMAAEAGGTLKFSKEDTAIMDELARRLRGKGVDPQTMQWLC